MANNTSIANPPYEFSDITFETILDFALNLNGLDESTATPNLVEFVRTTLNSILTDWINLGVLQFVQGNTIVKLQNNLIRYPLPNHICDVYDINVATMGRQRTGSPYSTAGGSPNLAFDGNLTTSCQQTSPNGTLGINFSIEGGNNRIVDYFGIISRFEATYKLVLEGSNDNVNFVPLYVMTRPTKFSGILSENYISWFEIDIPDSYKYLQIRETGGATLNISELYFMTYCNSIDRKMRGRSDYMQITNRNTPSFPNTFTIEKGNDHLTLASYGAPTNLPEVQDYQPNMAYFNYALMRVVSFPFNVNYLSYPININRLFIPSLMKFVAANVALQTKNYQLYQLLLADASESFKYAKINNSDLGGMNFTITRS